MIEMRRLDELTMRACHEIRGECLCKSGGNYVNEFRTVCDRLKRQVRAELETRDAAP